MRNATGVSRRASPISAGIIARIDAARIADPSGSPDLE